MRFCKNCGAEIGENTKFCKGCGKDLRNEKIKTEENVDEIKNEEVEKACITEEKLEKFIEETDLTEEEIIDIRRGDPLDDIDDFEKPLENKDEDFTESFSPLSLVKEDEKVEEEQIKVEEVQQKREKPNVDKPRIERKPKKVNKILMSALGALIVIIGVGAFVLLKGNSPESVVKDFETFLESGEVSKLKEILVSDSSLEISDGNVEIFIEGFKEAEVERQQLIKELKDQAMSIKENKGELNESNEPIFITKKKEGLKEKYYIGIKPSYISVPEIIPGASYTLKAGEKSVDVNLVDGKEEMLMPTIYNLEASLKNDYIETQDKKYISLYNEERVEVKLFEDVNKVTIETNDEEAVLIVNGKNTKNKLKDSKVLVGLKNGDIIQGAVEKDGKVRMSPKYTVGGTEKIYIEVEPEKVINHLEYTNSVGDVMEAYIKGMADAVNYNNFDVIKDYLYPGSQIYNEQIRFVKNTYESEIREYYVAHFVDDINFDDEKKEWTVRVNETFDIEQNGETKRKIFKNEYKLKVNEDLEKLQIVHIKVNYKD
ncbi:MAG: TcaA NTF2-like domain-containing protein [Clostridium sp.]|uniref:zinc ribbon domain-containing protein n=1 Tax=Clostridium sp. TaxID=1506 RepID=UPI003F2DDABD